MDDLGEWIGKILGWIFFGFLALCVIYPLVEKYNNYQKQQKLKQQQEIQTSTPTATSEYQRKTATSEYQRKLDAIIKKLDDNYPKSNGNAVLESNHSLETDPYQYRDASKYQQEIQTSTPTATSEIFTLKQNIVHISECAHPQNGFVLTGTTVKQEANNDSFYLDIDNKSFSWSDNKGTSKNKISNFKSKSSELNTQYVFMTESNLIRITINKQKEAVIEIICLINDQWNCLSYLCRTSN